MASLDREQLEALKRQIDDDYRLDMAAIERLLRRVMPSGSPIAAVPSVRETPTAERAVERTVERNVTVLPTLETQGEAQPDDLTNTLRGMFSSHRR